MEKKSNMKKERHGKSATLKKCSMERVPHGKSATWKKCSIEKVQYGKSATWKKCSMEKMKHEKSATWKKCNMNKCNMEKVQHENSRGVTRSPLTSKMENFAAVFNGFGNYCCKSLHRRCLWGSSLDFWKECKMNKAQQEKIATSEECNRRRMQNKNIVMC